MYTHTHTHSLSLWLTHTHTHRCVLSDMESTASLKVMTGRRSRPTYQRVLTTLLVRVFSTVLVLPVCRGYAAIPGAHRATAGAPRFDSFCDLLVGAW